MGNNQSQKKKIKSEVLNNTNVQMKFKKVNDTINETTVKVINEVSDKMKIDSKTQLTQKMGGIKLSGIKNSSGVKVDISQVLDQSEVVNIQSIQKIDQNSDVVQQLQKQLQTDMQRAFSNQQESSKSEGEQAMKELMGSISGVVSDAMQVLNPGGSKKSEEDIQTMIKNELNINNETELVNKTKNVMNSEMITKTLTEMSASFETYLEQIIDGSIEISDVENSKDVGIALKQQAKITRDIALQKASETGMGTKIMGGLLEIDETQVKDAVESGQKQVEKQQGTLEDAGKAVKNVGEGVATAAKGVGGAVGSFMSSLFLPLLVIGGVAIVGLIVIKPMLAKADIKDFASFRRPPRNIPIKKGGAVFKTFYQNILKMLINPTYKLIKPIYKLIKPLYKMIQKYLSFRNANIILGLIIGYKFIKIIMKYFSIENFTDEEVNKNYYIKVGDKYLKRVDGKIELTDKKEDASLISLVKIIDNIFLKFGEDLAITNLGKKLKIMKNKALFYPSQKIIYDKNTKSLQIGEDFVNIKDDKLELSPTEKAIVVLEE